MAKDRIVVGLEVGTSKVCAISAELKHDGTIQILGVGEAPSRGVRKGEIVDIETCGKCIREALADAEEKSDVMIKNVYLGITGAHIQSYNNRGSYTILEDRDKIGEEDFARVQEAARTAPIPAQNMFLHTILQHYYVDGQDGILNPIGMHGRKLEADFHIIHGVANRIKNSIQCLCDLDIEIEDIVFTPYAAAQAVLDANQKTTGAILVDIGGGTSGFIVYAGGAVKQSGVIGIGGDHITNDLSLGLRIPMMKAEKLKLEEGSCIVGGTIPGASVVLKDEHGFAGREIEREMLNTIIHMRVRETFELLKRELDRGRYSEYAGAGMVLTGGTSALRGIQHVAEEIFQMPVQLCQAQNVVGVTSAFENPQYSTAIGLVKYAQATLDDQRGGWFDWFKRWFR
ncbi:MAG: cell division protein FtsA [Chthoniobacteraceae bacterium]